ncbi:MAG: radical SAM family heme chaperone HemW [Thiohalomonas sp.]|nr:radical SAM family heme chaperone HemW [Thiohalomonas sp.]
MFIGGGTPSLIQPESLQNLLSQISARIKLSPMAEITMEANPGTVDQLKFEEFRQAGINRLSMGIQSFDDQLLKKIGRIHNSQQARLAIERAKLAGFDNINLDLMYALPGQTLKNALNDLQQGIAFDTSHLSHYQLTLEPNTLFASQPSKLPDDDLSYEMQLECQQLLADASFEHYEVSAYAKLGKECRHNLNYWQFGDYLGIGAGAHGKISDAAQQTITRRWKEKHPQHYLEINSIERNSLEMNSPEKIFLTQIVQKKRLKTPQIALIHL